MDFHYYPNITNKTFEEQLLKKKEFRNIYPENKDKSLLQQLQPQQEFLRQYISPDTPYNGVLIFHGTGVGKTCTAINIAEGFHEYSIKKNKRILILSSSIVKNRFIEEIYNFNPHYQKIHNHTFHICHRAHLNRLHSLRERLDQSLEKRGFFFEKKKPHRNCIEYISLKGKGHSFVRERTVHTRVHKESSMKNTDSYPPSINGGGSRRCGNAQAAQTAGSENLIVHQQWS